jgi:hypothetical protein
LPDRVIAWIVCDTSRILFQNEDRVQALPCLLVLVNLAADLLQELSTPLVMISASKQMPLPS